LFFFGSRLILLAPSINYSSCRDVAQLYSVRHSGDMARIHDIAPVICRGFLLRAPNGRSRGKTWRNAREVVDDFHDRIFPHRFSRHWRCPKPDGLRILDDSGYELFFWKQEIDDA
jgi:hypothetical protein